MKPTPKSIGRDCELSTTGTTADGRAIDPFDVTRAVLGQIDAAFAGTGFESWTRAGPHGGGRGGSSWSSDCLRHWTPNGDCFYSDMSHLECCSASTRSPRGFAARSLALLVVAEAARARAEALLEPGTKLSLSAANVDLVDPAISWGSHVNVQTSRELFLDLFVDERRPAVLGSFASALAAAIPFFGAGYVLPLRGGAIYSLSARAHHLGVLKSLSTTEAFRRGILNARRESHAGSSERLHLIGFDFGLASSAFLAAFLQCATAAAEDGWCGPMLYDPVSALRTWSFGLDLSRERLAGEARLVDGRRSTLPAFVRELCHAYLELARTGRIAGDAAHEARELLPRVLVLAQDLEEGLIVRAARHLDWAAKLLTLIDARRTQGLDLDHPRLRILDHDFSNTDPERGAFWRLWSRGLVDPLVTREDVEACLRDGPDDSRGFARGRMIQRFRHAITDVDWDRIEFARSADRWHPRTVLALSEPHAPARAAFEPLVEGARSAEELCTLLDARRDVDVVPSDPVRELEREIVRPTDPAERRIEHGTASTTR